MKNTSNTDFDPDFSEYNPIQQEIAELKEKVENVHKKGFWTNLMEKLTTRIVVISD